MIKMTIYSLYILNKHAGMIYTKDFNSYRAEIERVLTYPLDIKLDENGLVKFGARDGIRIGHTLMAVNGQTVIKDKINGKLKVEKQGVLEDVFEYLNNQSNFPVQLRFGKPPLSINDKIVLTGRFFG